MQKLREVRPIFGFCEYVLIIMSGGCGVIRGLRLRICDLDKSFDGIFIKIAILVVQAKRSNLDLEYM